MIEYDSIDTRLLFTKAARDIYNLIYRPSDEQLLELYGLYKQATIGDNDTTKPFFFDMKGVAKWEAWTRYYGMGNEEAMERYILVVNRLMLGGYEEV